MKISKITLGTVQLGLNYGINNVSGKPDSETSFAILDKARDGGINVFDTASGYGDSETVIGNYIAARNISDIKIVTKYKLGEVSDVETALRESAELSLEKLKIKSIDIYMSHDENEFFGFGSELYNTLKKLKSEHVIKRAGLSFGKRKYITDEDIDKIIASGVVEAVQLPFNLMDTASLRHGILKRLHENGIKIFARSIFLQGLFFKNPENLPDGVLKNAYEPLKKLHGISKEYNLSIIGLALAYVRDVEEISSLVIGAEKPEQIEEILQIADTPKLPDELRELITNAFIDIDERIRMPWEWNKYKFTEVK